MPFAADCNGKRTEGKGVEMAIEVLDKYFEEFTKKHYEKIQRGLNLNDEDFKEVINRSLSLNPKPGGNVSEINKAESYMFPIFLFSIIMANWN